MKQNAAFIGKISHAWDTMLAGTPATIMSPATTGHCHLSLLSLKECEGGQGY